MNPQKGFSLVEVLASLLLVTTLALSLLQQQWQSKQLLNQLILRAQGSHFLDQFEESLRAHVKQPLLQSWPFRVAVKQRNKVLLLQLYLVQKKEIITRQYHDFAGS
jgi:prepilin peptidase dependent protein C